MDKIIDCIINIIIDKLLGFLIKCIQKQILIYKNKKSIKKLEESMKELEKAYKEFKETMEGVYDED